MKSFILLSMFVCVSACTTIQLDRHTMSGYSNYEDSDFREVSLRELREIDSVTQSQKPSPRTNAILKTSYEPQNNETSSRFPASVSELVDDSDIALGMQKEAVRESWGEPDYVEVSGNPKFENERWRFSVPIKTPEGYQFEERLVYFERGRVVGWVTR